jgi:hypothetical protein
MDIKDLDRWILLKVLSKFGNINIHTSGIKIVVINPDGFKGKISFQDLVFVPA